MPKPPSLSAEQTLGMQPVHIHRLRDNQLSQKVNEDVVVAEQAITVMVDQLGSFTIMATPTDLEALAVGFIFAEGLIDSRDDLIAVSIKKSLPNVVGLQVQDPSRIAHRRNMIVASSCGMCGARNIEKLFEKQAPVASTLTVTPAQLQQVITELHQQQTLFQMTGGAHAAGVFDPQGSLLNVAEDLGRHSALDKAIGQRLLKHRPTNGYGVALSGRISLEMVTKAARAGFELIAAVSAPSSLAVEAAQHWNITLCGFIRPGRMNIYTAPERIIGLPTSSRTHIP